MVGPQHQWDVIRDKPTVFKTNEHGGVHESLLRSWHIVAEVKAMLERGDSPTTIRLFIDWAEQPR